MARASGVAAAKRKVLAIVADDHVGHPLALPPDPDGWELEDGNHLETNGWQRTIWSHWIECWQRVGDLRKGGELIVVHAGDAVEGVHHGTVQLATQRIDEQERMHVAAMRAGLKLAKWDRRKDKLIYLAGTAAHVGQGNSSTERIARALLETEGLDGRVIRDRLYASVNGVLVDVAHRGYRLGGREWTRTNSMRAYLLSQWLASLKAKRAMPRYVVRAHQHTFGYACLEDDDGQTVSEGWLMPAWKLKDEYVSSFAPEAVCSIGMLAFVIEPAGSAHAHAMTMRCEQDVVEEL